MDFTREDNETFIGYLKNAGFTDIKVLNSTTGTHDDKTWGTQFPTVFKYLKGMTDGSDFTTVEQRNAQDDLLIENIPVNRPEATTWTFMKGEGSQPRNTWYVGSSWQ